MTNSGGTTNSRGRQRTGPGTQPILQVRLTPKRLLWSGFLLCLGFVVLYLLRDQLREVLSSGDELQSIRPIWFVVMVLFQAISFACLWWLTRIVLPGIPWMLAATSQLVSNSVSRAVPGAAAAGGAVYYRMLAAAGIRPAEAGGALAASSVLSNAILFAIPAIAGVMALLGVPIPEDFLPPAVAASAMFLVFVGLGVLGMLYDRPLRVVEKGVNRTARLLGRLFGKQWGLAPGKLKEERDRLLDVLDSRWPSAIAAAAGNWLFDYLALVAALYSVGVQPKFLLVLLVFAFTSTLGMLSITPGNFGIVEFGLSVMLVLIGVPVQDAGLVTIAYRLVSMWLPLLCGPPAYVLFNWWLKRRGGGQFAELAGDDGSPLDYSGRQSSSSA